MGSRLALLAAAPPVPTLVDLSPVTPSSGEQLLPPAAGGKVAASLQQLHSWIQSADSATLRAIPEPCTDDNAAV